MILEYMRLYHKMRKMHVTSKKLLSIESYIIIFRIH